ncbi:MAG: TetR/AcrR family transcriptional regulator C-terminal domain-containing protein [Lachnospiraceae bacterium]|nr:TetR/AcrR family transcriptional regulator C-terminal domain-containing protein [Lachnospiraceae bacterium]
MEFGERTKYALADSLKILMETTPLDKITVKEIVTHCGTTRQTFYRNFKDKYDLVIWYFDKIVQATIHQMGISLTLKDGLIKKFTLMKQDQVFFKSAFSSSDYNNLLDYDYRCIYEFYLSTASKKAELSPDIIFLLRFYCHGSMYQTVEWAKGGMKESPEELASLLILAMPIPLEKYLQELN